MEIVLEYSPLVGLLVGIATIVFVVAKFGNVPGRIDDVEREVKANRRSLDRIEGRMQGNVEVLSLVALGRLPSDSPRPPGTLDTPATDE